MDAPQQTLELPMDVPGAFHAAHGYAPSNSERPVESGESSGLVGVGGEKYDEPTRAYHREYMRQWRQRKKSGGTNKICVIRTGKIALPPKASKVHYAATLKLRAGYYAESKDKATMSGSKWGEVEDALVMDYGKTARELSASLGRTFFAVLTRRAFLRRQNAEMGGGGAEPVREDADGTTREGYNDPSSPTESA